METENAVTALAALANEHRLSLFRRLVQAGPGGMAAGEIAEDLGVMPQTLSFHLKELDRAGLVSRVREGRSIIYAADFTAMDRLLGYLNKNCCARPKRSPRTRRTAA